MKVMLQSLLGWGMKDQGRAIFPGNLCGMNTDK